ncbi:18169_t:CDS:2 [Rhizophagus irregularis]|nr:18169_t:CDS:2 [Rhizophagus irregularis]
MEQQALEYHLNLQKTFKNSSSNFPMQGLQNPLTLSSFTPQSFTSQSITPHFYAHPTDSFTSIHPSPSNYEYTSYSLP